jgi:hypothetical protein
MRFYSSIAALLLVASGCNSGDTDRVSSTFLSQPQYQVPETGELQGAHTQKSCPDGHTNLREIPVVYGYIIPDEDFLRRVENREVIRAGCTVFPTESYIICLDCDFRFDTHYKYWEKSADRPVAFARRLSSLIVDAPVPEDARPQYSQKVRDNQVGVEKMWYRTALAPEVVAEMMKAFLQSRGLDATRNGHDVTAMLEGRTIRVVVHRHSDSTSMSFSISVPNFELAVIESEWLRQRDEILKRAE